MQAPESSLQKSRAAGDKPRATSWPAVLGFVLADTSLAPLFANPEAIAILTYPGRLHQNLADVLRKKIGPGLFSARPSTSNHNGHALTMELKSGHRTYKCRSFPLNRNGKGSDTVTLLLLERATSSPVSLSQFTQRFHLTHREQQAVALLLQGLSNKEMAESMGISANTVKAFLRMACVKMGASSRSGIVTKILNMLLSCDYSEVVQFGGVER